MSAVLGLCDLFDMANRMSALADGPTLHYDKIDAPFDGPTPQYDGIIVPPNLTGKRGEADHALHRWLAHQHVQGAMVCSACAGVFWLAGAGLLAGRPATTHWALEGEFRTAFPGAHLHPEYILIDDNDVVTAGGVMAWIDLGLHLVRHWQGAEVVSKTCRQMLIDPTGREQRNYREFRPNLTHKDAPIRDLQLWMEGQVEADLTVPLMAERAGLSTRTLQRRFASSTGLSLNQYVQELRVEKARGMLERTGLPISEICWRVGYSDVSAFSRLFKSISGLSAREYRRRFRVV